MTLRDNFDELVRAQKVLGLTIHQGCAEFARSRNAVERIINENIRWRKPRPFS
jgi:hypothetical protein